MSVSDLLLGGAEAPKESYAFKVLMLFRDTSGSSNFYYTAGIKASGQLDYISEVVDKVTFNSDPNCTYIDYINKGDPKFILSKYALSSPQTTFVDKLLPAGFTRTTQGTITASSSYPQGGQLSNNADYAVLVEAGPTVIRVFKRTGDTFSYLTSLPGIGSTASGFATWSPDGTYLVAYGYLVGCKIFKRSGDTFTQIADLGNRAIIVKFSQQGNYLIMYSPAGQAFGAVMVYKRTGDAFTLAFTSSTVGAIDVVMTPDEKTLIMSNSSQDSNPNSWEVWRDFGSGFVQAAITGLPAYKPASHYNNLAVSLDSSLLISGGHHNIIKINANDFTILGATFDAPATRTGPYGVMTYA